MSDDTKAILFWLFVAVGIVVGSQSLSSITTRQAIINELKQPCTEQTK